MPPDLTRAYLRLLRNSLTNKHYAKPDDCPPSAQELSAVTKALNQVRSQLHARAEAGELPQSETILLCLKSFTPEVAVYWLRRNSCEAFTLLDQGALNNIEFCVRSILERQIPGDLIECGVFRGGSCIFMRGLLKALGDPDRQVWLADSFEGLPDPNPDVSPLDIISHELLRVIGSLRVSLEQVKANFKAYDLFDRRVRFLPGWFSESLPTAPIGQLALIRLDADYYDSTLPALEVLYPLLSPGGFIIIDDYGSTNLGAKRAVDEYRERHQITAPITWVNRAVVFWEKPALS